MFEFVRQINSIYSSSYKRINFAGYNPIKSGSLNKDYFIQYNFFGAIIKKKSFFFNSYEMCQ